MVTRADSAKKRIRTGISISQTELCAADLRLRDSADRAWRVPIDPPQSENGGHWPSLTSGLAELARSLGVTEGTLAVSLMPPLTEVRRLELPPIRDDELQLILARGASKYFVGARSPQVVGASFANKKRVRGSPAQVVAAAAPARLIAGLRHAAQQAGWTVEIISPAEAAWAAAALAMWPAFAKQSAFALVAHRDRTDVLQIDDGRLVNVRRFRSGGGDASMILDTVGPSARIGLMGEPGVRRQLGSALTALGLAPTLPVGEWTNAADRPEVLAAHFAGAEIGPSLRSEDSVAQERAALTRMTWRLAAAAAALFVVAAGVELWGVHRQLGMVRAERETIRPQIASTMVGRTTVDAAYRHLTALASIERKSPHWSTVIGTLTDAIPEDAFLLAVRTRDDSVIVDGLAQRARRVFDALEQAHGLTSVRAAAPVRRELQEGGTEALEHFAIAARVVPDTTKPKPTTTNAVRRTSP
jgi:hypothetical protein